MTKTQSPPARKNNKPTRSKGRPVKQAVEMVKFQISIPHALSCKLGYMAEKHKQTRSEFIAACLWERARVVRIDDREGRVDDTPTPDDGDSITDA